MRRSVTTLLITCLLGTLLASGTAAQSGAIDPPPPGPPYPDPVDGTSVYDFAGLLSASTIDQVEAIISAVKGRSGAEVVFYSQVDPESDTAEEAEADAAALLAQWGVGRWGADDGLVVLLDMERDLCHGQLQLYAGRGFLTAYMTADELQATFDGMLPALSECDMDSAVLVAMDSIDAGTTFESVPVEGLFPTNIGSEGFSVSEPEIVRGQRDIEYYLLGPDPSPLDTVGLQEVAWSTGHTLDDMTQAWGVISSTDGDLQSELAGWQIPGVGTAEFADSFRSWAIGRMGDAAHEEVEMAGRRVTVFDTESLLGTPNYMYAHDDIVWLFAAPEEHAVDITELLPAGQASVARPTVVPATSSKRVEAADLGFALTVPEGWVAFDIGGDLGVQARQVVEAFDSDLGLDPEDFEDLEGRLLASRGQYDLVVMDLSNVIAGEITKTMTCSVSTAGSLDDYTIEELVPAVADEFTSMEQVEILRGPEVVELPSGTAYVIDISRPGPDGVGTVPMAFYFVTREGEYRTLDCLGPSAPADDWLSIVETWEWLPVDAAASVPVTEAPAVSSGERVEVPEQGYALVAPDDWISVHPTADDADSIIEALGGLDPDLAATVESALAGGVDFSLLTFGTYGAEAGFRENCNVIDYASGGDPVGDILAAEAVAIGDLDNLASDPSTTMLGLAAGDVGRLDYGLEYPQFETAHAAYYFVDDTTVHLLTCTGVERPEDDWLQIAETWEWLDTATP